MVANLDRPARAIENDSGANPRSRAHYDVTEDKRAVVDAHSLRETETSGALPAIEDRIPKRQASVKFSAETLIAGNANPPQVSQQRLRTAPSKQSHHEPTDTKWLIHSSR